MIRQLLLFVALCYLLPTLSLGQAQNSITRFDYWNNPVGTRYRLEEMAGSDPNWNVSDDFAGLGRKPTGPYYSSKVKLAVERLFSRKFFPGSRRNAAMDTDIAGILPRVAAILNKWSVISDDFDDGKDLRYSKFVWYAKNALCTTSQLERAAYCNSADSAYRAIPITSPKRALASLQRIYLSKAISEYTSDTSSQRNLTSRLTTIREMQREAISKATCNTALDSALLMECASDVSVNCGMIGEATLGYLQALSDSWKIRDNYARELVAQRIKEKMHYALDEGDNTRSGEFLSSFWRESSEQTLSTTTPIAEFRVHNKLLLLDVIERTEGYRRGTWNIDLDNAILRYLSGNRTGVLTIDAVYMLHRFANAAYSSGDYGTARRVYLLVLNIVADYGLVRYPYAQEAIGQLIASDIALKDYDEARRADSALLSPYGDGSYMHSTGCLLEAEIAHARGDDRAALRAIDSARRFRIPTYQYFRLERTIRWINELLHEVASGMPAVGYAEVSARYVTDPYEYRAGEYREVAAEIANRIRYEYEYNQQLISDSLLAAQKMLADAEKDSALTQRKLNAALRGKVVADRLKHEAVIRSQHLEAENRIFGIAGIFSLLIICATLLFFIYRSSERRKARLRQEQHEKERSELERQSIASELKRNQAELRKAEVELEKAKLEREIEVQVAAQREKELQLKNKILRGAFFGHAIKKSFRDIGSRIKLNIMNMESSNPIEGERALHLTSGLLELFEGMEKEKDVITLAEAIGSAKLYVETISGGSENGVEFQCDLGGIDISLLAAPSNVFIHFYVNSIWHGNLTNKKKQGRITTLLRADSEESYTLTIEDNGVGLTEPIIDLSQDESGLYLVATSFERFNQTSSTKYYFDYQTDIVNVIGLSGEVQGTLTSIKIIHHGQV